MRYAASVYSYMADQPSEKLRKFCFVRGEDGVSYNKCPKCSQSGKANPGSYYHQH